ncbi:hypothetical protein NCLIV_018110 [Neospora caninum Liverpool]|uniref:Uncharacterized protein n=1 Tax=Neospora caninum (strain Liverpool) TaxID=572307 RepID=F0VE77_NEOCL|nr:hypothetical protein NCLIV_018110 [Neospora caninum Liverpool]CBZ52021.1 hypothetical protein NCLIV_018110 [Neospora caninum Liverpool]CEL65982.1 TPA: hypothetical protein BN1204_018110 [Neospora caninum Liverpool]|eukprot:XP_003882053.1 hypothetical protein NCLIV_018110 [Neospora caninum Liverpool]
MQTPPATRSSRGTEPDQSGALQSILPLKNPPSYEVTVPPRVTSSFSRKSTQLLLSIPQARREPEKAAPSFPARNSQSLPPSCFARNRPSQQTTQQELCRFSASSAAAASVQRDDSALFQNRHKFSFATQPVRQIVPGHALQGYLGHALGDLKQGCVAVPMSDGRHSEIPAEEDAQRKETSTGKTTVAEGTEKENECRRKSLGGEGKKDNVLRRRRGETQGVELAETDHEEHGRGLQATDSRRRALKIIQKRDHNASAATREALARENGYGECRNDSRERGIPLRSEWRQFSFLPPCAPWKTVSLPVPSKVFHLNGNCRIRHSRSAESGTPAVSDTGIKSPGLLRPCSVVASSSSSQLPTTSTSPLRTCGLRNSVARSRNLSTPPLPNGGRWTRGIKETSVIQGSRGSSFSQPPLLHQQNTTNEALTALRRSQSAFFGGRRHSPSRPRPAFCPSHALAPLPPACGSTALSLPPVGFCFPPGPSRRLPSRPSPSRLLSHDTPVPSSCSLRVRSSFSPPLPLLAASARGPVSCSPSPVALCLVPVPPKFSSLSSGACRPAPAATLPSTLLSHLLPSLLARQPFIRPALSLPAEPSLPPATLGPVNVPAYRPTESGKRRALFPASASLTESECPSLRPDVLSGIMQERRLQTTIQERPTGPQPLSPVKDALSLGSRFQPSGGSRLPPARPSREIPSKCAKARYVSESRGLPREKRRSAGSLGGELGATRSSSCRIQVNRLHEAAAALPLTGNMFAVPGSASLSQSPRSFFSLESARSTAPEREADTQRREPIGSAFPGRTLGAKADRNGRMAVRRQRNLPMLSDGPEASRGHIAGCPFTPVFECKRGGSPGAQEAFACERNDSFPLPALPRGRHREDAEATTSSSTLRLRHATLDCLDPSHSEQGCPPSATAGIPEPTAAPVLCEHPQSPSPVCPHGFRTPHVSLERLSIQACACASTPETWRASQGEAAEATPTCFGAAAEAETEVVATRAAQDGNRGQELFSCRLNPEGPHTSLGEEESREGTNINEFVHLRPVGGRVTGVPCGGEQEKRSPRALEEPKEDEGQNACFQDSFSHVHVKIHKAVREAQTAAANAAAAAHAALEVNEKLCWGKGDSLLCSPGSRPVSSFPSCSPSGSTVSLPVDASREAAWPSLTLDECSESAPRSEDSVQRESRADGQQRNATHASDGDGFRETECPALVQPGVLTSSVTLTESPTLEECAVEGETAITRGSSTHASLQENRMGEAPVSISLETRLVDPHSDGRRREEREAREGRDGHSASQEKAIALQGQDAGEEKKGMRQVSSAGDWSPFAAYWSPRTGQSEDKAVRPIEERGVKETHRSRWRNDRNRLSTKRVSIGPDAVKRQGGVFSTGDTAGAAPTPPSAGIGRDGETVASRPCLLRRCGGSGFEPEKGSGAEREGSSSEFHVQSCTIGQETAYAFSVVPEKDTTPGGLFAPSPRPLRAHLNGTPVWGSESNGERSLLAGQPSKQERSPPKRECYADCPPRPAHCRFLSGRRIRSRSCEPLRSLPCSRLETNVRSNPENDDSPLCPPQEESAPQRVGTSSHLLRVLLTESEHTRIRTRSERAGKAPDACGSEHELRRETRRGERRESQETDETGEEAEDRLLDRTATRELCEGSRKTTEDDIGLTQLSEIEYGTSAPAFEATLDLQLEGNPQGESCEECSFASALADRPIPEKEPFPAPTTFPRRTRDASRTKEPEEARSRSREGTDTSSEAKPRTCAPVVEDEASTGQEQNLLRGLSQTLGVASRANGGQEETQRLKRASASEQTQRRERKAGSKTPDDFPNSFQHPGGFRRQQRVQDRLPEGRGQESETDGEHKMGNRANAKQGPRGRHRECFQRQLLLQQELLRQQQKLLILEREKLALQHPDNFAFPLPVFGACPVHSNDSEPPLSRSHSLEPAAGSSASPQGEDRSRRGVRNRSEERTERDMREARRNVTRPACRRHRSPSQTKPPFNACHSSWRLQPGTETKADDADEELSRYLQTPRGAEKPWRDETGLQSPSSPSGKGRRVGGIGDRVPSPLPSPEALADGVFIRKSRAEAWRLESSETAHSRIDARRGESFGVQTSPTASREDAESLSTVSQDVTEAVENCDSLRLPSEEVASAATAYVMADAPEKESQCPSAPSALSTETGTSPPFAGTCERGANSSLPPAAQEHPHSGDAGRIGVVKNSDSRNEHQKPALPPCFLLLAPVPRVAVLSGSAQEAVYPLYDGTGRETAQESGASSSPGRVRGSSRPHVSAASASYAQTEQAPRDSGRVPPQSEEPLTKRLAQGERRPRSWTPSGPSCMYSGKSGDLKAEVEPRISSGAREAPGENAWPRSTQEQNELTEQSKVTGADRDVSAAMATLEDGSGTGGNAVLGMSEPFSDSTPHDEALHTSGVPYSVAVTLPDTGELPPSSTTVSLFSISPEDEKRAWEASRRRERDPRNALHCVSFLQTCPSSEGKGGLPVDESAANQKIPEAWNTCAQRTTPLAGRGRDLEQIKTIFDWDEHPGYWKKQSEVLMLREKLDQLGEARRMQQSQRHQLSARPSASCTEKPKARHAGRMPAKAAALRQSGFLRGSCPSPKLFCHPDRPQPPLLPLLTDLVRQFSFPHSVSPLETNGTLLPFRTVSSPARSSSGASNHGRSTVSYPSLSENTSERYCPANETCAAPSQFHSFRRKSAPSLRISSDKPRLHKACSLIESCVERVAERWEVFRPLCSVENTKPERGRLGGHSAESYRARFLRQKQMQEAKHREKRQAIGKHQNAALSLSAEHSPWFVDPRDARREGGAALPTTLAKVRHGGSIKDHILIRLIPSSDATFANDAAQGDRKRDSGKAKKDARQQQAQEQGMDTWLGKLFDEAGMGRTMASAPASQPLPRASGFHCTLQSSCGQKAASPRRVGDATPPVRDSRKTWAPDNVGRGQDGGCAIGRQPKVVEPSSDDCDVEPLPSVSLLKSPSVETAASPAERTRSVIRVPPRETSDRIERERAMATATISELGPLSSDGLPRKYGEPQREQAPEVTRAQEREHPPFSPCVPELGTRKRAPLHETLVGVHTAYRTTGTGREGSLDSSCEEGKRNRFAASTEANPVQQNESRLQRRASHGPVSTDVQKTVEDREEGNCLSRGANRQQTVSEVPGPPQPPSHKEPRLQRTVETQATTGFPRAIRTDGHAVPKSGNGTPDTGVRNRVDAAFYRQNTGVCELAEDQHVSSLPVDRVKMGGETDIHVICRNRRQLGGSLPAERRREAAEEDAGTTRLQHTIRDQELFQKTEGELQETWGQTQRTAEQSRLKVALENMREPSQTALLTAEPHVGDALRAARGGSFWWPTEDIEAAASVSCSGGKSLHRPLSDRETCERSAASTVPAPARTGRTDPPTPADKPRPEPQANRTGSPRRSDLPQHAGISPPLERQATGATTARRPALRRVESLAATRLLLRAKQHALDALEPKSGQTDSSAPDRNSHGCVTKSEDGREPFPFKPAVRRATPRLRELCAPRTGTTDSCQARQEALRVLSALKARQVELLSQTHRQPTDRNACSNAFRLSSTAASTGTSDGPSETRSPTANSPSRETLHGATSQEKCKAMGNSQIPPSASPDHLLSGAGTEPASARSREVKVDFLQKHSQDIDCMRTCAGTNNPFHAQPSRSASYTSVECGGIEEPLQTRTNGPGGKLGGAPEWGDLPQTLSTGELSNSSSHLRLRTKCPRDEDSQFVTKVQTKVQFQRYEGAELPQSQAVPRQAVPGPDEPEIAHEKKFVSGVSCEETRHHEVCGCVRLSEANCYSRKLGSSRRTSYGASESGNAADPVITLLPKTGGQRNSQDLKSCGGDSEICYGWSQRQQHNRKLREENFRRTSTPRLLALAHELIMPETLIDKSVAENHIPQGIKRGKEAVVHVGDMVKSDYVLTSFVTAGAGETECSLFPAFR